MSNNFNILYQAIYNTAKYEFTLAMENQSNTLVVNCSSLNHVLEYDIKLRFEVYYYVFDVFHSGTHIACIKTRTEYIKGDFVKMGKVFASIINALCDDTTDDPIMINFGNENIYYEGFINSKLDFSFRQLSDIKQLGNVSLFFAHH